jgi:hypothetical protein
MEGKEGRRPLLLALAVPSMALAVGAVEELATVAGEEALAAAGGGSGGAGGGGKRRARERRETRLGRYFAI